MKSDGVNTILRARDIYVGEAHTHLFNISSRYSGPLFRKSVLQHCHGLFLQTTIVFGLKKKVILHLGWLESESFWGELVCNLTYLTVLVFTEVLN